VITTALTGWGGHAVAKPTTKKACRMADMAWLLRKARMTVEQLAYLYGVSVWTIRRDLLDMQDEPMRVPLSQDERGRWYVV
jgi:predicted DNA-binding transcriptional regulator YafY